MQSTRSMFEGVEAGAGPDEVEAGVLEARLTALYRTHRDRLLAHAYGITRDFHAACDLVQETFLRAARERRLMSEDFHAAAWLLRVCGNLSLNRVRDEARRTARETGGPPPRRANDSQAPLSRRGWLGTGSFAPDAAEEALRRQMGRELLTAMDTLPAAYRRVLLLRYAEGLSCAEISELLDVPVGTVMSWVHRARLVLRRRLSR